MSHPEHPDPDCPFCLQNGQLDVIEQTDEWSLVKAKVGNRVLPGAYLVIANPHVTNIMDLHPSWGSELQWLIDVASDTIVVDNVSINLTKAGGRTIEHLHWWILETQPEHQPIGLYEARVKLLGDVMKLHAAELRKQRLNSENDSLIEELASAYEKVRRLESEAAQARAIQDDGIVVQPGAVQRTVPALADMSGTH